MLQYGVACRIRSCGRHMALTPAPDLIAAGLRHAVGGRTFRLTGHRLVLSARQQFLERPALQQLAGVFAQQRLGRRIGGGYCECEGDGQTNVPIHHAPSFVCQLYTSPLLALLTKNVPWKIIRKYWNVQSKARLSQLPKSRSVKGFSTARDATTDACRHQY